MIRQRKAKKRRRRIFIFAVEAVLLIVVLLGIYFVSAYEKLQKPEFTLKDVKTNDLDQEVEEAMTGFTTYALFGVDARDNATLDKGTHGDVVMVASVNNATGEVRLASIYRDTYVQINEDGDYGKLTGAYFEGGALNAINMLNKNFDLDISAYVTFNWAAVAIVINDLGGVDVDVKIDFNEQDENRSFKKSDKIYLKKGMQTLNGKEALAYARHRKTEGYGTTGRENAQQQIIQAIMKKLTTAEGISHINDLMNVASKYVATNMPLSAIQSFVSKQLRDVKPWSVDSITLKGGTDATLTTVSMPSLPLSCYLLSPGDIVKVYNAYQRMYDSSPMKNFAFNLSTNPQCTIKYPKDQSVSEFMITSAAADRLNPYSVYYGIDRVDSSNAGASEQRAQTNNIEIVVPQAPVYDYYVPSQPDYVPDTGGENTGSSEPVTPPATDPGTGDGDGTTTTPPSTDPGTGDGGGTTTPPATDPGTGDNGGSTTPSEPVTPPADTGTAE